QTFRPKKKFEPGTLRYSLHKQAIASLNSGINLREVVRLPPGEDQCDWIAVHVVDFFNRINLIYGIVTDYCTDETCPKMSGGQKYEYLWADGVTYKKPVAPARQQSDVPFPKTFVPTCKKILTRLFRVFVHVYIHHFDRLLAIGAEAHCNTCYKHFYFFIKEFDLVSAKEFDPLSELTRRLCDGNYRQSTTGVEMRNGK
ncbi:MOB-like protein phocein, partial [Tyrophagus putrescentiae]